MGRRAALRLPSGVEEAVMIPGCCESFVRNNGRRGGAGFEGGRAKSST